MLLCNNNSLNEGKKRNILMLTSFITSSIAAIANIISSAIPLLLRMLRCQQKQLVDADHEHKIAVKKHNAFKTSYILLTKCL